MTAVSRLRPVLKRGASVAATNWQVIVVQVPDMSFQAPLAVPVLAGGLLVATAGPGLIAFVPFVGPIVVPTQVATWPLGGVVFQCLSLPALGAYLAQCRVGRRHAGLTPAEVSAFLKGRIA